MSASFGLSANWIPIIVGWPGRYIHVLHLEGLSMVALLQLKDPSGTTV